MKITQRFQRGTLGWGLLAFILIMGAMLVPIEWVRSVGGVFGAPRVAAMDAFSDEVAAVDNALENGAPLADEMLVNEGEKLESIRVFLQTRRLTHTGSITVEGMNRAVDIFREFNPQIDAQTLEGAREALRRERNRRIIESSPLLDEDAVAHELQKLRAQIAAAKENPHP